MPRSQGWKLNGAIKTTERKLAGGELIHDGSALMAWCVGNAKVEPKGNAVTITKQVSGAAKIDPLMSLFNAVSPGFDELRLRRIDQARRGSAGTRQAGRDPLGQGGIPGSSMAARRWRNSLDPAAGKECGLEAHPISVIAVVRRGSRSAGSD
ncbi:MAG: hypothetical protein WB822_10420 [Rhodoplanes sp.]